MTYIINKTDGTELIKGGLEDEVIDTETLSGIGLIGRLTPNYGKTQSDNFVHLVENFSNIEFPKNPLIGQICYKRLSLEEDNFQGDLYVCVNNVSENDDDRWKKLPLVFVGDEYPSNLDPSTGDLWYDTNYHIFKVYDEVMKTWMEIGPDNISNIKTVISETTLDSDTSETDLILYGFDPGDGYLDILEKQKPDIGYLITISAIGREVVKSTVTSPYMNSCSISGWKIQLIVNYYRKNARTPVVEIIDKPDYELIGTNNKEWSVKAFVEETKLKLKIKSQPSNANNNVKWKIKMDMIKVS